jgi:hypothetical protein
MNIPQFQATSNAITKSVTGAPAALFPTTQHRCIISVADNSGGLAPGTLNIETTGVLNFYYNMEGSWTASNIWTIRPISVAYTLA